MKVLTITFKHGAVVRVGGIVDVTLYEGKVFGELRRVEVTYPDDRTEELHWLDVTQVAAVSTEEIHPTC